MALGTRVHIHLPTAKHTHTIILLHGHDSTASEFALELFQSQASDSRTLPRIFPSIKWVFPTSGLRKSARFECEMSQWFDMWSVESPEERKELQVDGLMESVSFVLETIGKELAFVPAERIILGGISQGCATAVHALLALGKPLGGFVGFCGWMPFQDEMEALIVTIRSGAKQVPAGSLKEIWGLLPASPTSSEETSFANLASALATPFLLSHSKDDEIVPVGNGLLLRDCLVVFGVIIVQKTYEDGGHWVNEPLGVDDMVKFIKSNVSSDQK